MTSFTEKLTPEQAAKLQKLLKDDGFEFEPKPYTICAGRKGKLTVSIYEKGPKVLVQGKGTEEFVQFRLEPEILGEARLGYEKVLNPEMFQQHFGIDESGKGDYFGPLVIAGVYVDEQIASALLDAGVQDSKRIGSDAKIRDLADAIKRAPGVAVSVVAIGPAKYNELYQKIANLNQLLAWGHARVIENLVEQRPDCPRALSDQFGNPRTIQKALLEKGRKIELQQRTKAESDIAVAAASILARERFIGWLDRTGRELGVKLPRGVSDAVKKAAAALVEKHGAGKLHEVSKAHFNMKPLAAPSE